MPRRSPSINFPTGPSEQGTTEYTEQLSIESRRVIVVPDQDLPVSTVICAYNAEKYLQRALQSICEQTYQNLEILVIDDASTDGTPSVAAAAAKSDGRIRIISLEQNEGIARARQVGLENVSHDWIQFLDADDVALPTMVEKQVAALKTDPN